MSGAVMRTSLATIGEARHAAPSLIALQGWFYKAGRVWNEAETRHGRYKRWAWTFRVWRERLANGRRLP